MLHRLARLELVASPARRAPVVPEPRGGAWDLDACYAYCAAVARSHPANFPVASGFLPAELAPHVAVVYAFARVADDFADEPEYEGRRGVLLDAWEERLHRCLHGEADHPIFAALAATVERYDLPFAPFAELLAGLRMDLVHRRYTSFAQLLEYVERAARPVGRLLMAVFGVRDARRLGFADDLSTALALTNFWQNLTRDLERDRVYVPLEDLAHFGVTEADLRVSPRSREVGWLVRYECARTRAYYERARPLVELVDARVRTELGLIWQGGRRALDEVDDGCGRAR